MTTKKIITYIIFIGLFTFISTEKVHALSAFIDAPETAIRVGNTFLLKVVVDSDDKEINAVEGSFIVSNPKDITSITTGGSILSLWPKKPSLEGERISFTGGSPSGFYGNNLKLFTLAIKPSNDKPIKINFEEISGYLNDGKGTKISIPGKQIELLVYPAGIAEDELVDLIDSDKKPPAPFKIDLGRDPSLHDGKYFISFFTTDNESGINHYEVKENGFPMVRSGTEYVLQNQNLKGVIEVKAIDNAENVRTEKLALGGSGSIWKKIIITILVIFIAIFSAYFVFRRKRKQ